MARAPLALLCLALCAFVASSCASKPPSESEALQRFEYLHAEMGSPFRMVFYARGKMAADSAASAAFRRIAQLNDIMSDYDPDSELSRLSRSSGSGTPVHVSADLWEILRRAQQLAERSGGAFDVTVGPYVNLWRQARRTGALPDPARLERAGRSVGYKYVRLDSSAHTVLLLAPDMRLDLGGIAKGYAADQALKVLASRGIDRALIAGAGDLAVSGPPPGKLGWRIELSSLDTSNAPPARFVHLAHGGISTSGDLFQRLEVDGKRYSHLINPHTGMGLTDHSLVTVIGPDDTTADSLTKVASVLSPIEALNFIDNTPGTAVRILRQPGGQIEVYESKNFARYYESP